MQKILHYLLSGLFFCCLSLQTAQAQKGDVVHDFELWKSLSLSKVATERLSFTLNNQLRLDNYATEFKTAIVQLEPSYELFKWWKTSLLLRYAWRKQSNAGRIAFDQNFKFSLGSSPFKIRARIRSHFDKVLDAAHDWRFGVRIRPQLNYEPLWAGKWSFMLASFENYLQFDPADPIWYRYRVSLGVNYTFSRQSVLSVNYVLQNEPFASTKEYDHVMQIVFAYSFDKKERSKREKLSRRERKAAEKAAKEKDGKDKDKKDNDKDKSKKDKDKSKNEDKNAPKAD